MSDFLAAIGYGDLSPHSVVMRMSLTADAAGGDLRAIASRGVAADGYLRELTGYLHSAISQVVSAVKLTVFPLGKYSAYG